MLLSIPLEIKKGIELLMRPRPLQGVLRSQKSVLKKAKPLKKLL
ncbi:hypothetical protein FLAVO9AF_200020 [Flavobacterium sp. 9AF]|nr:hypothetical protein FLAVO9AF_200020 [Flavobacterium sp. 9AF]